MNRVFVELPYLLRRTPKDKAIRLIVSSVFNCSYPSKKKGPLTFFLGNKRQLLKSHTVYCLPVYEGPGFHPQLFCTCLISEQSLTRSGCASPWVNQSISQSKQVLAAGENCHMHAHAHTRAHTRGMNSASSHVAGEGGEIIKIVSARTHT